MTDTGLILTEPRAGWVRPVPTGDDEADDVRAERIVRRVHARQAARREWLDVLGLHYRDTVMLPLVGGGALGPVIGPDGRALRWSIWAPAQHALLDVFARRLPPDSELRAREAFAREHGLRYGVVTPDRQCTVAAIREWLRP